MLDIRTTYSFLRGFGTPAQIVQRLDKLGVDRFGVMDYCSTFSHIPLMLKANRQMAFGCMLPVVHELDKKPAHGLVGVVANGRKGLPELYELVSKAHAQSYYRPRVTWDQLREATGLTKIGYVVDVDAFDIISEIGYVAVSPTDVPTSLQKAAIDQKWPMIYACNPSYPSPRDKSAYEMVLKMSGMQRAGEALNNIETRPIELSNNVTWLSDGVNEIVQDEVQSVLDYSVITADEFGRAALPIAPDDWSLKDAVHAGLDERGLLKGNGLTRDKFVPDEYQDRIERELGVIQDKGFDAYFWFVADAVQWAKEQGILVGPGRGSAGGSLVAYLLGITEVDPLVYGTLFERFIDPTRNDFPDIDVDFADVDRDLVFGYLSDKYGADHVARIGTITWLGGKSAVNDVMRFERHIPWAVGRHIGDLVDGADVPVSVILANLDETGERYLAEYPELAAAGQIDGQARHSGIHAAGVCVAAEPIRNVAAVAKGVASLTMGDAEDVGLLKFDALGLTTLSVIGDACREAGVSYDEIKSRFPDDDRVFDVFRRDDVTGIFQFEGQTVRGLMREVAVDRFSDLCALTSLARPGPLNGGAAGAWVRRRSGDEDWTHVHDAFAPILEDTYGLIVYQEQFMRIMREIAGFSVADVNKARKAVGKKIPEVLAGFRGQFLEGAGETIGEELADVIWSQIEDFGSYAFNLSHAVAYSLVSYHTALLRAYHPAEFDLALLRHSDNERAMHVLRGAQERGMAVVPFDPVRSQAGWSIQEGTLMGGFTGQIGIGEKTAGTLLDKRDEADDVEEWLLRLTPAQKLKLSPTNNPWSQMDEVMRLYGHLFNDPDAHNIRGPVLRIQDVPHKKGSYCFIAKIKEIRRENANDPKRVAKRGFEQTGHTDFLNVIWIDDGIEIGSTINRFDYQDYGKKLVEDDDGNDILSESVGSYYLVRGEIIGDNGPKWIMINRMKRLEQAAVDDSKE